MSESVYAHLDTLNIWLKTTTEALEQIDINPLPTTPEEPIEKTQVHLVLILFLILEYSFEISRSYD